MVGIVSIIAIAGLFYGLMFLNGNLAKGRSITVKAIFSDVNGLPVGGEVRLAGVVVGQVADVTVNKNQEAEATLRLDRKYPVPVDSQFIVQGSVLGNTSLLTITPGTPTAAPLKDGDTIRGTNAADLQSVLAQSQQLLPTLQKTAESAQRTMMAVEKIASDPAQQKALRRTLANMEGITAHLNAATASLPRVTNNAEEQLNRLSYQSQTLIAHLDDAAVSGKKIAHNGELLTSDLRDALAENRKTLRSLLQSADESASALAGLLNQAGGLINDPKIKANLVTMTDNLASVTARLDVTTSNIEALSSDPRLAADLRETLANLKETTASIKNITGRVETIRIPGEKRRPGEPIPPPAPPKPAAAVSLIEPGLAIDSFYDTTQPRLRADVDYTLRTGGKGRFYRAGLYDLTESNQLNLQVGQALGAGGNVDFAYRYGLLAGKFGLGMDTRVGPLDFRLDAYDPNHLTGNARAKLYLNRARTQSLLFGVDDLARDNRAVIGVQIRN